MAHMGIMENLKWKLLYHVGVYIGALGYITALTVNQILLAAMRVISASK